MRALLYLLLLITCVFGDVTVKGIKLQSRQDNYYDGYIKDYEIYNSNNGVDWSLSKKGSLSNNKLEQVILFPTIVTTRYIKIVALNDFLNTTNAAISEISLIDKNNISISRSTWNVSVDSEVDKNDGNGVWGPPVLAIDGKLSTFWITDYRKPAPYPHQFIIDTGEIFETSPIVPIIWDKSADNILGYKVYYSTTPKVYTTFVDVKLNNTYTLSGLTPNNIYYVVVTAYNATGESPPSNELVLKIIDKNLPSAPISKPTVVENITRYINVLTSIDGKITYNSIGKIPYPVITGQKYKTLIVTELDPAFPQNTRYINILMNLPNDLEYKTIGKVAYPYVKNQTYKTAIINE
jgi:hypothetical protein